MSEIKFDKVEEASIGSENFGDIFVGKYKDQKFAIKRFKDINVQTITEAVVMSRVNSPYLMQATGIQIGSKDVSLKMELMSMDLDRFLNVKAKDRGVY